MAELQKVQYDHLEKTRRRRSSRNETSVVDAVAMNQAMFNFAALLEEQQRRMRSPLNESHQIRSCMADRSANSPDVFHEGNDDLEIPGSEHISQLQQQNISAMELDVDGKQYPKKDMKFLDSPGMAVFQLGNYDELAK
ncbi:unnamed protein product [Toxocara canis]|uniref:Uncharacterized protein n=1 Tax=Toxocara canis TaxID=6265 RepID=A0A183TXC0_TOXCA|nr:unnamed protein product [Toxocara canis]